MITVFLTRTPDQAGPEVHQVDDLLTFLRTEFGAWPAGGRIIHMPDGAIVTPGTPSDIPRLRQLPGPFSVEVFPREPATITAIIINLAISAALALVSMALAPTPPSQTSRTIRDESPNNGLSDRVNRERVNGRVPDIYGTVRSTPDLLQAHRVFENHVEKEIAYMCIGRGAYDVSDIRDDTTPIADIAGASVAAYGPNTSPNSGAPQLTIGNAINVPVMLTKRANAVNGQILQPPNYASLAYAAMRFESPNLIRSMDSEIDFTELFIAGDVVTVSGAAVSAGTYQYVAPTDSVTAGNGYGLTTSEGKLILSGDQSSHWGIGQVVTVTNGTFRWTEAGGGDSGETINRSVNLNGPYTILGIAVVSGKTEIRLDISQNYSAWPGVLGGTATAPTGNPTLTRPSGAILYNLSGVYTINTLTAGLLTLSDPAGVNADWNVMADSYGGVSPTLTTHIQAQAERWIGWFIVESVEPVSRAIANVVALNGLYADNGRQQYRKDVTVQMQAVPIDAAGNPTGGTNVFDGTIQGSATSRSTRALTMDINLSASSSRWKFRMRRTNNTDTDFDGQVVDEIKWRDLYAAAVVSKPNFGDVTTIQSVTYATDGALAIKERKLNALVTRKLPQRVSGSTFTSTLHATNNVADILSAICLDPRMGNRSTAEVDFDNLYATAAEINSYFGVNVAQFNYTIDSDNLSFEETVDMIAQAVYCKAYRRGSVLRLFFERETNESAILFNHRNKVPGSEQRTTSFGTAEAYDGVEFQWVRPSDDSVQTMYLPADRSAVNPKRVESVGVRVESQAHFHAWRAWNKIRYQNETIEFDALPEANLLTLSERILCADNTRGQSQDGEIMSVDGLVVELSQPFDWGAGTYTIFLQGSDGLVESMPVASGGARRFALLSRAPRVPLVVDGYNQTKYIITNSFDTRRARPFLVTEKSQPNDDMTIPLTAINYDARYYANDGDYRA